MKNPSRYCPSAYNSSRLSVCARSATWKSYSEGKGSTLKQLFCALAGTRRRRFIERVCSCKRLKKLRVAQHSIWGIDEGYSEAAGTFVGQPSRVEGEGEEKIRPTNKH